MRARMSYAAAAVSGVAAIAATVVGVRGVYGDQSAPVVPTHTGPPTRTSHPTDTSPPTVTEGALTAQQIVDDRRSGLSGLVVSPDDTKVRASVWYCLRRYCGSNGWAVAVTSDDFQSASYAKVADYADVEWVGGETFAVRKPHGGFSLITTSGAVRTLRPVHRVSPLVSGQTLMRDNAKLGRFYAVDPHAGTVHPIPLPSGVHDVDELYQQGVHLWGLADGTVTLVSSSDGGATWNPPTHLPKDWLYGTIVSGDPQVLALIQLGEDGVEFPSALRRSLDGGATWQSAEPPDMRGLEAAWVVVTPDGRLLLAGDREHGAQQVPTDMYESTDDSWTSFTQLPHRQPNGHPYPVGYIIAQTTTDGNQALYLAHGNTVYVSTDGGRTWQPTHVRAAR